MSVETPNQKNQSSILRLQQTLNSCSQSIGSEASFDELVCFLNSVSESALSHPDDNDSINNAFEVVSELHRLLISPQLDLAVIDALSFELPKAAAKFGVLSERCLEVAYAIIDRFVVACNPRDMLSILCEALDSSSELFNSPGYFAPILSGLSKVLVSIQRRHFENVKVAVPAILNVFTMLSSDFDDGDTNYEDIFNRVIDIGDSIQAICTNLVCDATLFLFCKKHLKVVPLAEKPDFLIYIFIFLSCQTPPPSPTNDVRGIFYINGTMSTIPARI